PPHPSDLLCSSLLLGRATKGDPGHHLAHPLCFPDICQLPEDRGPCRGYISRWLYNKETGRCKRWFYGGCGGNANNFKTLQECEQRCVLPGEAQTEGRGGPQAMVGEEKGRRVVERE
uniref:BPTI/Kunitz inhibitor domain-containing protein n=1 Tax=Pseudonaja textilis TaxID=8673 RepID=A0A670ZHX9_PSETE